MVCTVLAQLVMADKVMVYMSRQASAAGVAAKQVGPKFPSFGNNSDFCSAVQIIAACCHNEYVAND